MPAGPPAPRLLAAGFAEHAEVVDLRVAQPVHPRILDTFPLVKNGLKVDDLASLACSVRAQRRVQHSERGSALCPGHVFQPQPVPFHRRVVPQIPFVSLERKRGNCPLAGVQRIHKGLGCVGHLGGDSYRRARPW